tara:strand:- start:342 stop:548 length:207 start_codon:yes stop_codon:yes gene_type:complete
MENRKKTTESEWSKFVSSFEDYITPNPYDEIDEMYLTPVERSQLYDQATAELKAKIQVLRDKKKKKEK